MNEIKCPNCGKVFQVDEAGYAAIVAQVHTEQFEKEIADRLKAAQRELEAKQQAAADGDRCPYPPTLQEYHYGW